MTELDDEKPCDPKSKPRSVAARALQIVHSLGPTFFNDGAGEPYLALSTGEGWPIRSTTFKSWLLGVLYRSGRLVPSESEVKAIVGQLAAAALFGGASMPVFIRVGRESDSTVYLDLCRNDNRLVVITRDGWRVQPARETPVRFHRSPTMSLLPVPVLDGRLDELRPHINMMEDDEQWALAASFLISCLVLAPRGPFPILMLHGPQGTLKTSTTEMCSNLIDPRRAAVRALPTNTEQLSLAADSGYLLAFDNVSEIGADLSDALCRLSTGAGFARRAHYENREEVVFDAARPVLMNGIGNPVVRGDLAERTLVLELPVVPPTRRKPKAEVTAAFERAKPRILGGLCTAVSTALANADSVRASMTSLPRLADFAIAAVAAEPACGVPPGTFQVAFDRAQFAGAQAAAGDDPVACALVGFLRQRKSWKGSASELLDQLRRPDSAPRTKWPDSATKMGTRLTRISSLLRSLGIEASQMPRTAKVRGWTIELTRHLAPVTSREVPRDDTTLHTNDTSDAEKG